MLGCLALLAGCGRLVPPSTAQLPDGLVGTPYRAPIPGSAGVHATWRLVGGELPTGLELAPTSGVVQGTPTRPGESAFTVDAVGAAGTTVVHAALRLRVLAPIGAAAASPTPRGEHWQGSDDYELSQRVAAGPQISKAHVTISLDEAPGGALSGSADGFVDATLGLSNCPSRTVSPAHFHGVLSGERTPERMQLHLTNVEYGPIEITPCPTGGKPGVIGGGKIFYVEQALAALTSEDGAVYRFHSEKTFPSYYPYTITHTVEVRRGSQPTP